ncbi:MAG: YraN family protein [Flavobacteriaceae bacterium]
MPRSHQLGKLAEKRALNYLLQKGYLLRETNYRFRKAEVDLIMQQTDILVCVEVKACTHLDFGHPASFI